MNKKIILLILALGLISGLTYLALDLSKNKGKSDVNSELHTFNIEDTSTVDRIVITDPQMNIMEIKREGIGAEWTDKEGSCIIPENAKNVMYILHNIEFKGYVAEGSREQHIKLLSTSATKVEIYQKGRLEKTWYIGTATPDHHGQVMLLDSRQDGRSNLPVLMKVRGVNGIIEPSFSADNKKWSCTDIFAVPIRLIKKIEINNFDDPGRSFTVTNNNYNFSVKQAGKSVPLADTTGVIRYLSGFKKVNFEMPNYLLNDKQIDSLKKSKPFGTMKVVETNNKSTYLKFYRLASGENLDTEFGEVINHDLNSFWCFLPDGTVVKCQYFVFDPLMRGDIYFPFDKSLYQKQEDTGEKR